MKDNIKVMLYFSLFMVLLALAFFGYNKLSKIKIDDNIVEQNSVNKNNNEDKIKLKEFKLTLENGEKISSKELITGKPIVINIWTSWCTYCDKEMEYFNEMYIEEKDNVSIIMINATGDRDSKERAKEYVKTKGYSFEIYYDFELESIKSLGIRSYPTTIFVNKDGYIESKVVGAISREILKNKIQSLK